MMCDEPLMTSYDLSKTTQAGISRLKEKLGMTRWLASLSRKFFSLMHFISWLGMTYA